MLYLRLHLVLSGIIMSLLLVGCGNSSTIANTPTPKLPHAMPVDPPPGSLMLNANFTAGDALAAALLQRLSSNSGILVTSFTSLDDLDHSSSFGRIASQQVSSRIGQNGFKVIEVRLADALRMDKKEGEFMLSRDSMQLLNQEYDAHAVLVGVYTRTAQRLFVSTRVVRLVDNAVLAAYEYYLPSHADVNYLLHSSTSGRPSLNQTTNALWNRYAPRHQSFSHNTSSIRHKEQVVTTPLIHETPRPSGGVIIDPQAPPRPIGRKHR